MIPYGEWHSVAVSWSFSINGLQYLLFFTQHIELHQSYSEPIAMLILSPSITVEWNHWFVSSTTTTQNKANFRLTSKQIDWPTINKIGSGNEYSSKITSYSSKYFKHIFWATPINDTKHQIIHHKSKKKISYSHLRPDSLLRFWHYINHLLTHYYLLSSPNIDHLKKIPSLFTGIVSKSRNFEIVLVKDLTTPQTLPGEITMPVK